VLAGLNEVFVRPIGGRRIINAINREIGLTSESAQSDELYCQSAAMRSVSTQLARAAGLRDGVLVRGEEGSGRQVVARAIHAASSAPGHFVVVDCASGDPRQLGAQLFGTSPDGHNFGSRDFERVSRESRLHDALGGTLYLRNITEAPNRIQARLARVFRDREAVLVESDTAIDIDVRLVASVTPDIEAAVREGRLRDDVYRRLAGIAIDVPALRNRREDIPLLANCLLRQACSAARVPAKTLSRPALSLICALPWRGNGEELATLLRTIVDNGAAGGVGLDDVLRYVQLNTGALFSEGGTLRQARAQFERRYIISLLEQHRGRMTDAAKSLGIQRTNLYRKMRTLKITRERRPISGARAS
jgi:two-component system nitrogen regulation response regulator NtrX